MIRCDGYYYEKIRKGYILCKILLKNKTKTSKKRDGNVKRLRFREDL